MSESTKYIKVVCEGPTDFIIIRAAVAKLMKNISFVITQIQPESSLSFGNNGPHGGGWKGVKSWCEAMVDESGRIKDCSVFINADILVIHIDADIASDREINCLQPCPPACDTTNKLRKKLLEWAGEDNESEKVVICIPSKSIEAWVLAALYPDDSTVKNGNLECRLHPERLLVSKPEKLVRKQGNKYHKDLDKYMAYESNIANMWQKIIEICTEARRFSDAFIKSINLE